MAWEPGICISFFSGMIAYRVYGFLVKSSWKWHLSVWVNWIKMVSCGLVQICTQWPTLWAEKIPFTFGATEHWKLCFHLNWRFLPLIGLFFWTANKGLLMCHDTEAKYYMQIGLWVNWSWKCLFLLKKVLPSIMMPSRHPYRSAYFQVHRDACQSCAEGDRCSLRPQLCRLFCPKHCF